MKYKNIVFDIGGVLLSYRWLELVMETVPDRETGLLFAKHLYEDKLWVQFDLGIRPFDDILDDYTKKYPEEAEYIMYVMTHLERMPLPRPKVWEKVHALKEMGYHLYLLSNYSSRMLNAHTKNMTLPFFKEVDGYVISYEVHSIKPDKEIYEALFDKYSLDPKECIFFDDRQENVDGARLCGMEGRVIYSEEVLLGYLDRLLAKDGVSNPFHDHSIPRNERIDWLLSNMNKEEKIILYSHPEYGVGRFGVEGFVLGGEAAHGVEARNEQNFLGDPDITTSFPNPIGMSSSWDPGLIKEAGHITGTEARACWNKHRKTGLSRWAPTIDPERDPRWGRNEEGYGEDPLLSSENATAYIKGMQGDNGEYVLCGATLKHFYANNKEDGRFFINSSVGLRDKMEYYLPPFRTAIEEGHALGVMTAYNKINGIPGMTNPEVRTLLKEAWGVPHAVCDGFAMIRLKDYHHEFGTLAECLAASVKAGVDSMSDKPEDVEKALRDALELGILSEDELDGALKNILMVAMKLGIYDPEDACPYNKVSFDDTDSEDARNVCRRLSSESLVLLENKNSALPLDKSAADDFILAGPLADEWFPDWYAGHPPFRHSVKDGLCAVLGHDVPFTKGLNTYRIISGNKAWSILPGGSIGLSAKEDGDTFYIEDWGDGIFTIRSAETGKYVQSLFYGEKEPGGLKADKDDIFDWFVTCRFAIEDTESGLLIKNRFGFPVYLSEDGTLRADDNGSPLYFQKVMAANGALELEKLSSERSNIILVLGCNSMIPAREDYDRSSLALPSDQQKLLNAAIKTGKKVIAVLISNYPYTMQGAEKNVAALLLTPSGSEYMGDAVASAIFGDTVPAGRLPQSWPASEDMLPDMNDYRIIGNRTYRYVSDGWLYPFGYGLSYGSIQYTGMEIPEISDKKIKIRLTLMNIGAVTCDEVVQIYASMDDPDERLSPAGFGRRLIAFTRVRSLKPGETRNVNLSADISGLQIFDAVNGEYVVCGGHYHIYAASDALSEILSCNTEISGAALPIRDLSKLVPVYTCDDSHDIEFQRGAFGMTAAAPGSEDGGSCLIFKKCHLPEKAEKIRLLLRSETSGSAEIIWNDEIKAVWEGNTSKPEKHLSTYELPTECTKAPLSWPAVWTEVECDLNGSVSEFSGNLMIRISGDISLLSIKFA